MDRNQVSILLRGLIHPSIDIKKTLIEYNKYGKIILSIYKHEYHLIEDVIKDFNDIEVVLNDVDVYNMEMSKYGVYHPSFYQLNQIKNGLTKVVTPYVIESRVDHYYSNIDKLIKRHIDTNKIVTSSIFVRGFYQYKYHLSDCFIMGKTDEITKVIDLALEHFPLPNVLRQPNEVQLWKPYIFSKLNDDIRNIIDHDVNTYLAVLSNIFEIININEFAPYICKVGKKLITQFHVYDDTKNFLLEGCHPYDGG